MISIDPLPVKTARAGSEIPGWGGPQFQQLSCNHGYRFCLGASSEMLWRNAMAVRNTSSQGHAAARDHSCIHGGGLWVRRGWYPGGLGAAARNRAARGTGDHPGSARGTGDHPSPGSQIRELFWSRSDNRSSAYSAGDG